MLPRAPRSRNSVHEMHIAIMGMNRSGKSALTVKYITRRYITEYDPNLEDTYCKHENLHGHEYMVWIMDTVEGKGKDPTRYLSWADIYLVVYDITSQMSFQYAEKMLKHIGQHEHALCVRQHVTFLIGNKNDMDRFRQVNRVEAQRTAEEYGAEFAEMNAVEEYAPVKTVFHKAITASISLRMRAVERSPSPRMYSSDSEVVGAAACTKNERALKSSRFRHSKSPKHSEVPNKPLLPPNGKSKSGTGSKLFKLFQT